MASVVTTEFVRTIQTETSPFSLIEQQSLLSRLIQAIKSAFRELAGDPKGFIRDLLSTDTKDAKRRKRFYLGLTCGLLAHVLLIVLIAAMGWRSMFANQAVVEPQKYTVRMLERVPSNEPLELANKPELPKGSGGGGGGGQHTALPPSHGTPPPMMPGPQLVSMNPSNIPEPTLPVSPTIVGPLSPPPPPGPIGDPTGKTGEFSGGPGVGGGVGRGDGPGVGGGKDAGSGTGGKGGKGGGSPGAPDASASAISVVDFNRPPQGYKTWTWIRRQTAIITPEAQENKVMGTVLLRATFNADGSITDIEILMRVDFMNEAAVEALRRSTFRPATINGVPVTVRKVPIKVDVHY